MEKNKISIIIPIYNSENHIFDLLMNIKTQTLDNYIVFLIDDGSTDRSGEICKDFIKKDDRFIYIYKENGGVSSARNLGIQYLETEYVIFLDSDDTISENFLERLLSLINNADTEMVISSYYRNSNLITSSEIYFEKDFVLSNLYKMPYLGGFLWNKIYKTEIIKSNNIRFDEEVHFAEDLLFNIEYLLKMDSNKIFYSSNTFYYYVTNESSITGRAYSPKRFTHIISIEKIIDKLVASNVNKEVIKLYQNLLAKVVVHLFRNGYNVMTKNEKEKVYGLLNKIKLKDVLTYKDRIALIYCRVCSYFSIPPL